MTKIQILITTMTSFITLSCSSYLQRPTPPYSSSYASESYYIFKTTDLNFEPDHFGIFCSNEYSIRIHLNTLSSGPYSSSYECEESDQLATLRKQRKQEIAKIFKDPSLRKYKKAIENQEVKIGMPRKAVILSLGEPSDVNRTQVGGAMSEQLVYPGKYIYLRNGTVYAIQD